MRRSVDRKTGQSGVLAIKTERITGRDPDAKMTQELLPLRGGALVVGQATSGIQVYGYQHDEGDTPMLRGHCNCGSVAFEVDAEVSDVFVCHCSICRRSTGGNGVAVVIVENEAFRWLSGKESVSSWSKPDVDWQAWFCCVCGSTLPGPNDDRRMFVPAGLISHGGESLAVKHHIWVGSKAVWDEIGDSGQQHLEAFRPSGE